MYVGKDKGEGDASYMGDTQFSSLCFTVSELKIILQFLVTCRSGDEAKQLPFNPWMAAFVT